MQKVCIVVPCFNEEHRLPGREILEFVKTHDATICFVDDGSSDGTLQVIEALQREAPQAVIVLGLQPNRGKAEAVRQGILHVAAAGRFAVIGFCDADLSTPLGEVAAMVDVLAANPSCELAMGSRIRRLGSCIERTTARHYLGRTFSTLASLLLKLPVYDSQCGAKVMRADIATIVCAERFLTKWLFDVEILARLRNHFGRTRVLESVTEVPLTKWTEVGGSKLRLSHMARVPLELLRISRHYNGQPSRHSGAMALPPIGAAGAMAGPFVPPPSDATSADIARHV
jgi:glycosyltransferase involved in cell wall biosynthesis